MPNTLFFGARKQGAPFSLYRKETQMDQGKLERILKKMEERNLSQMIITDPPAIFYLPESGFIPAKECWHCISTQG